MKYLFVLFSLCVLIASAMYKMGVRNAPTEEYPIQRPPDEMRAPDIIKPTDTAAIKGDTIAFVAHKKSL